MSLPALMTLQEVAAKLRKSERWLWDWLDKHRRDSFDKPYYRLAGRTKLFSEGDLARIIEDLPSCTTSSSDRPGRVKRRISKFAEPTLSAELRLAAELTGDLSLLNNSATSNDASKNTVPIQRPKLRLVQASPHS